MTVKRFTIVEYLPNVIQIEDNNQKLNSHEIVDLLNELHDECEFLEIENESLEDGATKYAELYHKSLKENESLNSNIDDAIEQISKLHSRISELSKELKKQSEEHRENDFKLQTLEKYYTCPQCEFNSSEFEYLQSLRRIE